MQKTKIQPIVENSIKEYIDKNEYLFRTDTDYEVECGLKPRLVYLATENACSELKNKGLTKDFNNAHDYNKLTQMALSYAVYYMNYKTT